MNEFIKRWSEAELFSIFENHVYISKKSYVCTKICSNFIALKLIQHVMSIGSIKNLDTGSYFVINMVNFLAPKLIQHVIAFGSIKNLDTGS